jgi:hypothetical protein
MARIVQRRAAIQNCWRCPVQQNFCADPPVIRGVNIRSHHRQNPSIAGSRAGSSTVVTDPQPRSAAITARFLSANVDLTPAAINDSGPFSRSSKVVCITALYSFT